jgi:hypothetical protein
MICTKPKREFREIDGVMRNYKRRCGNCESCRITRRQEWALRIILESKFHKESVFVTLTYNDWFMPKDRSVHKHELQNFLKRLRRLTGKECRYAAVGEYGETGTERPHYHLILFGLGLEDEQNIINSWTSYHRKTGVQRRKQNLLQHIVKPFTVERAWYVAKYTLKKLTNPKDKRLNGRKPEFGLFSKRPALGARAIDELAQKIEPSLRRAIGDSEDFDKSLITSTLTVGSRVLPMGQTLKNMLYEKLGGLGLPETKAQGDLVRSLGYPGDPTEQLAIEKSKAKAAKIVRRTRDVN